MRIAKGRMHRWGAAAVEMAVVMPFLLTLLFGIIEYGWVFTIRQCLTNAAREGARTAALPGSTEDDVMDRSHEILNPLGLSTATITLTRSTPGNPVETVRIAVPYSDVTLIGAYFGTTSYDLVAQCSMRKEGLD